MYDYETVMVCHELRENKQDKVLTASEIAPLLFVFPKFWLY